MSTEYNPEPENPQINTTAHQAHECWVKFFDSLTYKAFLWNLTNASVGSDRAADFIYGIWLQGWISAKNEVQS